MNCNSRHSFRLYFSRLSNLIDQWILNLQTALQIHTGNKGDDDKKEKFSGIKKKWKQFKTIIRSINIEKEAEYRISVDTYRLEYAYTILAGCKMGLGP